MKLILPLMAAVAVGAAMLLTAGCGSQATTPPVTASTDQPAATNAVLYTCPMHPEIVTNQPGSCPLCGMTLVLKK